MVVGLLCDNHFLQDKNADTKRKRRRRGESAEDEDLKKVEEQVDAAAEDVKSEIAVEEGQETPEESNAAAEAPSVSNSQDFGISEDQSEEVAMEQSDDDEPQPQDGSLLGDDSHQPAENQLAE
jgi:hypothetical protein